jgi:hypothetical protein
MAKSNSIHPDRTDSVTLNFENLNDNEVKSDETTIENDNKEMVEGKAKDKKNNKEGFFSTSTFANSYLNISILTTNCVQIKYIASKNNWNDLNKALIALIAVSLILQIIHGAFLLLIASLKKILVNIKYNTKNLSKNLMNVLSEFLNVGLDEEESKNKVKEAIKTISNHLANNSNNDNELVDNAFQCLFDIIKDKIYNYEIKHKAFKALETLKILRNTFDINALNSNLRKEFDNFKNMLQNMNGASISGISELVRKNENKIIEFAHNIQDKGLNENTVNFLSNIIENGLNDPSSIFTNFLQNSLNADELKNKAINLLKPLRSIIEVGLKNEEKKEANKAIDTLLNFITTGLSNDQFKNDAVEAINNLKVITETILDNELKIRAKKAIEIVNSIFDLASGINNLKKIASESTGFSNIFQTDEIKMKIDTDFKKYSSYISLVTMFIVLAISLLNIIINIFLYGIES